MLECLLNRYESCLDSSVGDTFEGIVEALLHEVESQGMIPPSVCGDTMADCGNFWESEDV